MAHRARRPVDPRGLSPQVRRLGWVSMLTDLGSEMAYPLFPIFVTSVLGAPAALLGLIEGIAEATASLTKYPFGQLADRTGKRRPYVLAGYGLGALGKLLVALATGWPIALGGRIVDRLGKGMRTAPRDDLLAAATPPSQQGRAFGLHRAMDTMGAVLGPLVGLALVQAEIPIRWIIGLAALPGFVSVFLILRLVREHRSEPQRGALRPRLPASPAFRWLLLGSVVFAVGNSSDMFLLLKAQDAGLSTSAVLLVYVLYNAVYSASSLPLGRLSDRIGQYPVVLAGYLLFAVIYVGFAISAGAGVIALFAVYGLYIAATEGTSRALIGRTIATGERASALGLYSAATGLAAFAASTVAGVLWSVFAPWVTFAYGASMAFIAATVMLAGEPMVRRSLAS